MRRRWFRRSTPSAPFDGARTAVAMITACSDIKLVERLYDEADDPRAVALALTAIAAGLLAAHATRDGESVDKHLHRLGLTIEQTVEGMTDA